MTTERPSRSCRSPSRLQRLQTESNYFRTEEPVSFEIFEQHALKRAIEQADGNAVAAAELLAVGKSAMYRRLAVHQMK